MCYVYSLFHIINNHFWDFCNTHTNSCLWSHSDSERACVCVCTWVCVSTAVQCEVCTQRPAACDCQSYDSFGNSWASSAAIIACPPPSLSLPLPLKLHPSLIPAAFSPLMHLFLSLTRFVSSSSSLSLHFILSLSCCSLYSFLDSQLHPTLLCMILVSLFLILFDPLLLI